jgi:hypothetical protein
MLRHDLEEAGIAYVVEGPDGPLYADFPALRHSYIALLDQAGATLKLAMKLAGHSDPRLSMKRYGRAHLHELGSTVDRLPTLLSAPGSEAQTLRATGTTGQPVGESLRPACAAVEAGRGSLRAADNPDPLSGHEEAGRNPLKQQGLRAAETGCNELRESSPSRNRTYILGLEDRCSVH